MLSMAETMFAGAMNDTMNFTEASLPVGFRICNQPNTGLWSTILALSTFVIAVFLRKLRQGKFLGKTVSVQCSKQREYIFGNFDFSC